MEDLLINFRLVGPEAEAVKTLSAQELRKPALQVRYILLQALKDRGMLAEDGAPARTLTANDTRICGQMANLPG